MVRTFNDGSSDRVAAIVPSTAPTGVGTVTVSRGGASSTGPIEIVAHAFGVFTLNSAGSGPAIMLDPIGGGFNTIFTPFQPGDLADVYGTGLGALPAGQQDNVLPTLTNLPYNVEVTVGTKPAQVVFNGRDAGGCCAAIDLIRFIVPEVSGCHLPVLITVNGAPANMSTMSVGPEGQTCSDGDDGLSGDLLSRANQNGMVTIGTVNLNRTSLSVSGIDIPMQTIEINQDTAAAGFWSFTPIELRQTRGITGFVEIGTCVAFQFDGQEASNSDPVQDRAVPKDAGTITLTGPRGTQTLDKLGNGLYFKTLSSGIPGLPGGIPGFPQTFPPTNSGYLDPGNYTATGSGGPDIGPFSANITVPSGRTRIWTPSLRYPETSR